MYTSLPIIIYSIFDYEVDEDVLIKDPDHYKVGLKRIFFN